jgi:type 2 lantibiotic biosynthesis protein LanM
VEENFLHDPDWHQAATLTERITSLSALQRMSLRGVFDADVAGRRIKRWRSQPPFVAGPYFAQRLAMDGLDEGDLLYCLGEPVEALRSRFANSEDWLAELFRAFSRPASSDPLPLPETLRSQETTGFLTLIEPLLRDALERVQAGAQALSNAGSNLRFDPSAITALLFASLPQKLLAMLSRTMVLELHVARLEGLLDGATAAERFHRFLERLRQRDVALGLLEEYPVLARQLVVRIDHWVNFSLEFLEHLAADWPLICAAFAAGDDPGPLADVNGDAGDGHRGGRSVLIAKFGSGLQVVYKPRSLRVDVHFQELLAWLNARGDHPPFRTLEVLDLGNHGWTEFIGARDCSSAEEVWRFYERQGAYLALLYALEATDLHFENLIAAGEHPMLLDLEALFHPRVGGKDLRQAEQLASNTISYSVLRVGLLPQRSWGDGESAGVDLSGLGSLAGQLTPQPVPRWEREGTDEMRLIRKRIEMPGSHNQPTLNGAKINVLDYTDAIVAGFTSLYRSVLTHRDELLSDQGPVLRFADDEVRVIMRGTYTYGVLLRESFHPDVLRNALDRDRLFDRLWIPVEYCPHLAKVIPQERQDLQNGDIPLFTTHPNSRDLWSSAHERIADFLDEPGIDPVRQRIKQLSDQDCARQLWFVRASLATLCKAGDGTRWPAYRPSEPTVPAARGRLVAAACGVGDRLEELALRGEDDISWIGLTLAGQRDWALVPLGLDLYDGLPGVALFLAYLGEISGERRYTELAQAILTTLRRQVERGRSSLVAIGAFGGWGGIVYVLTHLSMLWDQPDLLTDTEAMVERIRALIERDEQFDIISGAAGCIGSLLSLHRCSPSECTRAAAVQCGDHLVAHAQPMPHGLGWLPKGAGSKPLTGFSHGAAGIAWALLKLATVTGEERFRTTALAALEYERSLFSPESGNWPDLRDPEASGVAGASFAMAWCHGAPGIGLGRLLCLRHLDDPQIRSEIDAALATTLGRGFGNNHSLCHGDLGNLDTLLEASLALGEPRWRAEVDRVAAIILESTRQNGWLCGNPLGVESPGLMTGLAGIGYELLRLAEPDRVPSPLALEPPLPSRAVLQSERTGTRGGGPCL